MPTYKDIAQSIIAYYENNPSEFEELIEELDDYDGCLGDERYYAMGELDELYAGTEPTEILRRAFFGYDEDTYDAERGEHGEFNPNRDYFRFDGYGTLVSSNYKDYSAYLDEYFVEDLCDRRDWLNLDPEVEELLDQLDEAKA